MKMTSELATLAEAEEDLDDEDEDDYEEGNDDDDDENASSSGICTFDVPHFRYIDDDDVEESKDKKKEQGQRDGSCRTLFSCPSEEDCHVSVSHRYVVVSGTPLKILEHLLSDMRLDDQRGAPESRESGKFCTHNKVFCLHYAHTSLTRHHIIWPQVRKDKHRQKRKEQSKS